MNFFFELKLLKYNINYIILKSCFPVPYGALLSSRLNDLRDSAYLAP